MAEANSTSNLVQQAAANIQQNKSPDVLEQIGAGISDAASGLKNFFTPKPELVAEEQEINRLAVEKGMDPSAIRLQLQTLKNQQSQQAQLQERQAASEPQVGNTDLTQDNFVAPQAPAKSAAPAIPSGPDMSAAKAIEQSFAREQQALKSAAEAGALKATEQAAHQEQLGKELMSRQAKMDTIAAELDRKSNEEIQKLQDVQQKTADFKFKDFWEDKSTGQKIMAGIAMALGGIGGTLTGKFDNKAFDVINQGIERDLNLQKLNLAKLEKQGDMSKSVLAVMNQRFDNQVQAENASRIYLLQASQNELSRIANKYESPELKAKAEQLNQQLERQKQVYSMHFKQQAQQQHILNSIGANTENLTPQQESMLAKTNPEFYKIIVDRKKRTVTGLGLARNEQAAKKASDIVGARDRMVGNLKRMQEILKKSPVKSRAVFFDKPLSDEATTLQSLYGDLTAAYKDYGQLGTLDRGVQVLMDKIVKDPTSIINPTNYNNTIKMLEQNAKKTVRPLMENMQEPQDYSKLGFKPR